MRGGINFGYYRQNIPPTLREAQTDHYLLILNVSVYEKTGTERNKEPINNPL
jgi:hypothetical protein